MKGYRGFAFSARSLWGWSERVALGWARPGLDSKLLRAAKWPCVQAWSSRGGSLPHTAAPWSGNSVTPWAHL